MLVKTGPKKFYGAYSPIGGKAAAVVPSFAKGVNFNGSTYISSNSGGLTTTNGRSYLISIWFRQQSSSGYTIWFESSGGVGGFSIQRDGSGTFAIYGQDSASVNVATFTLGLNPITDGNWHHLIATADVTVGTVNQVALDGTLITTSFAQGAGNINFAATTALNIGARGGSLNISSDVAELYIAYNQTLNLATPANVQKFRSVSGHPVDLGAAGATPTGTAPTMYFSVRAPSGVKNDFLTNRGTGGRTWTEAAGTLTLSTVDP